MKKFEFLEHTADLAVRIFGSSVKDLFVNAADTLFNLISDYEPEKTKEKTIKLFADNYDDLLVSWLNDLISGFWAEMILPSAFEIDFIENEGLSLKAKVKGCEFNPYQNPLKREIKAATYHNVNIKQYGGVWETEVVFDV